MAFNSRDRRWLEQHGGTWRVTVAVPKSLRATLGTRLKKSLRTDSLSEANKLKLPVVQEFLARISRELGGEVAPIPREIVAEALEYRKLLRAVAGGRAAEDIESQIRRRGYDLIGADVGVVHDEELGARAIHDPGRLAMATEFVALATGSGTPIATLHEQFVAKSQVKARSKGDDVRVLKFLTDWCRKNNIPETVEAITKKVAVKFSDELGTLTGPLDPVTQNKYLTRLSRFWAYMVRRQEVEINVWNGLRIETTATPHDEEERAFTDEEVRQLLIGGAPPKLMDVIMVGALSGARLDAVVDLKIKDIANSTFRFKKQKGEPAPRFVPIHPDLEEIVRRRIAGKGPDDDFFPEWPGPKKAGSHRERSFKTSNAFTAYRRECGVDERIAGKRRSRVNFHSFRRWFITKAERAGFDEALVAAIVGHKREGITFNRYSEGPEMKRARRCVAAVKLPLLDKGPVPEPEALMPRKQRKKANDDVHA